MSATPGNTAVIIGASYAGLCAGAAFRANGWNVTVYERSPDLLRSGGGVVVQRRMAEYLEQRGFASPGISSVPARLRMLYQQDGSVLRLPETARSYTAWDVLLREFERAVTPDNIVRGRALTTIEQDDQAVRAVFDDGSEAEADLLIAADGVGSTARNILLPDARLTYAGYVAWRGTVDARDLPPQIRDDCADTFSTFTGDHTNIVAYEIPGADGSVEPSERRINWVWYVNVAAGPELDLALTSRSGRRKTSSLPRGEARPEVLHDLLRLADALLPGRFAGIVRATPEPFAHAVQDYRAPRIFFDRAVLIGDAACVIRPHLGAGTDKAVEDAVSLADAVCGPDFVERGCLRAWEQVRLEEHHLLAEQARVAADRAGLGTPTQPAARI